MTRELFDHIIEKAEVEHLKSVTVELTPAEFRLLRDSLLFARTHALRALDDATHYDALLEKLESAGK